jgi:hypothetical protein
MKEKSVSVRMKEWESESVREVRECNLIKAVFSTIGDIDNFDDDSLKSLIEHVRLWQFIFEIGKTSEN